MKALIKITKQIANNFNAKYIKAKYIKGKNI